MKTSITSVQLAILETKQLRTLALLKAVDGIQAEAREILGIHGEHDGVEDDALSDYLTGGVDSTAAQLAEFLGIEVLQTTNPAGNADGAVKVQQGAE